MSLRTVTWDYITKRINALVGYETELRHIQPLVDEAIRFAYESEDYWPRYLNLELRDASRGYVEYTEDSFYAYGAGTTGVNTLFRANGTADGVTKYTAYAADGTTALYDLERSTTWAILAGSGNTDFADDTSIYTNTDTGDTPPTTGWVVDNGATPAPRLSDVGEIGEVLRVWDAKILTSTGSCELDFYEDGIGISVPRATTDLVFVAYKEELPTEFGDGVGGTVADIPYEFSEYAIYDAAYQLQFSHRQSNANAYTMAYSKVQEVLDQQRLRVSATTGHRILQDRFKTRWGEDISIR